MLLAAGLGIAIATGWPGSGANTTYPGKPISSKFSADPELDNQDPRPVVVGGGPPIDLSRLRLLGPQ